MNKNWLASTLLPLLSVYPAIADERLENIETIVIQGELLETTTDTASNAVDVVNKDMIEQLGAAHLQDILQQLGNVNFAGGSSRARFFQIRGMGERSQFVDPVNPSVGLAIDGIDYSGLANAATLFDISQIEVFKGPQGTNIGANAMAGFINMMGTKPGTNAASKLRLEMGNYGLFNIAAAHGGDIGEHSAYRVAINKLEGDGYIHNAHLNRDDTNGFDELSLRLLTTTRVNQDLTLDAIIHKFDIDNGYDAFSLDQNRTTYSNEPGFDTQDTLSLGLRATYTGVNKIKQKLFLSNSDSDLAYGYDEDWAFGEYEWRDDSVEYNPDPCASSSGCLAEFDGYSSTDYYFRDHSAQQLDYSLADDNEKWIFGVYFKTSDTDLARQYTWLSDTFESQYQVDNAALYSEVRMFTSSTLNLTAGLRIENYDGDYSDSNLVDVTTSDTMWGGHVSAINHYDKQTSVYVRISRGFKAGGVNGEALSNIGKLENESYDLLLRANESFRAEILENIEMGIRLKNKSETLSASANIFFSSRDNMQVKQWITPEDINALNLNDEGGTPTTFVGYISNAPKGANYGVETSLSYLPNPDIKLSAGLAWIETDVEDLRRESGEIIDGRAQAHAPEYQYFARGQWQITDRLATSLSFTGKDSYYYSFSHDLKSSTVNLINASLTYSGDYLDITLWGRNLTDQDYGVRGFYFGNDPRDGYTSKLYEQLGEPMVYGIKFDYVF